MRWLLLVFLLLPGISFGQDVTGGFLGTQNSLVLVPSFPSPGQEFSVTLDDYSGGAYGATIDWVINDALQESLRNNRSLNLTAGAAGDVMKIDAVLTLQNGTTQTISRSLTPRYLDIIFEPQTHVPGFYQGRPLPSQGSQVNATALLHNTNLQAANLIYTWRVGNKVLNSGPLRGQNKISFTVPMGRDIPVTVEVTDTTGETLARRSINLPSVSPEIVFYEVNTLYGLTPLSVSSLLLLSNSTTVRGVPYFLDSRVFNQPDVLEWRLDRDSYTPSAGNPYEINLMRTQTNGSSVLQFRVTDTTNFLQGARSEIMINY